MNKENMLKYLVKNKGNCSGIRCNCCPISNIKRQNCDLNTVENIAKQEIKKYEKQKRIKALLENLNG